MRRSTTAICRLVGLLAGFGLAAAGIASWHVEAGTRRPGATLKLLAAQSGELEVSTVQPFLEVDDLQPGPPAAAAVGHLDVRNLTGSVLDVQLRAVPSSGDLDQFVHVEVAAGQHTIASGHLGQLRQWSELSFQLKPGEQQRLLATAWLLPTAGDGYHGRVDEVTLQFQSRPRKH
jgi:hypothetical protein